MYRRRIAAGWAVDQNRPGRSELGYTLESEGPQGIELGKAAYDADPDRGSKTMDPLLGHLRSHAEG